MKKKKKNLPLPVLPINFKRYLPPCLFYIFIYVDACSQYRFQYHQTGTGVSYRWYWSFTYVVLECYLCGTGKELICINQAFPIDVFLVFKIQTLYSMINYYFPHI